jgi:hypothetical protein
MIFGAVFLIINNTKMKKILTITLLTVLINFSVKSQNDCLCYTVQGLNITGIDSLELVLSNDCSLQAYLNMYVISSTTPFDTLARWEDFGGYIPPTSTNESSYLHSNLTIVPSYGTYRVSITNGNFICDSVKFATAMGIADLKDNEFIVFYPNPASGILNFRTNYQGNQIRVRNLSGQVVLDFTGLDQINVSSLNSGIYLIEVYDNRQNILAQNKLVIQ